MNSQQTTKQSQSPDNQSSVTQLSLPKGGGAIQGIGETFQANEFTGTASFAVPLLSSPCRGAEPQLALAYSSGSGNGPFGLGWGLSIPAVARKTSKGQPYYNDSDTFVLSGAEDLVPIEQSQRTVQAGGVSYLVNRYRPRVEGTFAKIEYWQDQDSAGSFWRTITPDNITSVFGYDSQSRVVDPAQPAKVFQWLLTYTYDAHGNVIRYDYKAENTDNVPFAALYEQNRSHTAEKYIEKVRYGNADAIAINAFPSDLSQIASAQWQFELLFDYGQYNPSSSNTTPYTPVSGQLWASRQDPFSRYDAGFEMRTHRLCKNVLLFHRFSELGNEPRLVHCTQLTYDENTTLARLSSITSTGYTYDAAANTYTSKSLPALNFSYTTFDPEGHAFEPLKGGELDLPGTTKGHYQLIDLYGEGIPGVFYNDGVSTRYWEPRLTGDNDERYRRSKQVHHVPLAQQAKESSRLMDLSGNGQLDWVLNVGTSTGYHEGKASAVAQEQKQGAWSSFKSFAATPSEFFHPQIDLVDMTGDGLADIVLLDDHQVRVYPSRGKQGFGKALTSLRKNGVPVSHESSLQELVQFADVLGSGRAHRVRVRNGSVECWPSLGYGRFGQRVQLANAPSFRTQFDARRLFLVDVDGSGTADIAYVHSNRVEIYFNQSGNGFSSTPMSIALPSRWDQLDQISFADVQGNGTNCLVFTEAHPSPRQWYYDFCQRKKPYLLNKTVNNLGAETELSYESSTLFYLQDKEKGEPWQTSLPFPVQVVAKVETRDLISQTTLKQVYSYHHGYYDEVDREFRGFGRVERQDAEVFDEEEKSDVPYVSPALAKTWYHTGAPKQNSLTQQYREEYYTGDAQAAALPDSTVNYASGAGSYDRRGAQRSLKGRVLREELYGLDGSAQELHPYTVVEHNYHVEQLQVRGENRYAVFFSHAKESLSYTYERNPTDPQFSHQVVLRVDEERGLVLQTAELAYGRRSVSEALDEQQELKVTSSINRFIHKETEDIHLLGVPKESLSYEVPKLSAPSEASEVLSFDFIKGQLSANDPEAGIPFAGTDGSISVKNEGGYVARFYLTYTDEGERVTQKSGDFTSGFTRSITIPAGASEISLEVEEAWFINQWKTIFTKSFSQAVIGSYKIWGTTLSPKWEEIDFQSTDSSELLSWQKHFGSCWVTGSWTKIPKNDR